MEKDTYATWRSLFILSFEFEYRTIRTIKRDTNGELGLFQVLIVYLSYTLNTHPKGSNLQLFCPCCLLFGGFEVFLGGSDHTGYSLQRFQRSEVPRFFSEVPNSEI
jgi:hypothetical protein